MEEQSVRPDLVLSTDRTGDVAVVKIKGELDAYTAPSLEEEITRQVEGGVSDLVLELRETDFLDSSGLRAILSAQRAVGDRGGKLSLRAPSHSVRRLLDIAGLTDQFVVEQ